MNCLDCETYGPCEGKHGCALKQIDEPEDDRLWQLSLAFLFGLVVGVVVPAIFRVNA